MYISGLSKTQIISSQKKDEPNEKKYCEQALKSEIKTREE